MTTMDGSPNDVHFSQMPEWLKINETVIVPCLENTMNEMKLRKKALGISEELGAARPFNLIADQAIASAIQQYGLRLSPAGSEESDEDCPTTQAKKMRTGGEDDIVDSAIESAIAEKGLR